MHDSPALDALVHALGTGGFGLEPQRGMFLFARPHPGLADWRELTGWQPWRRHATAWEADALPRADTPAGTWPLVLALPGKSRDETLATFAAAHNLLEEDGVLLAALANDSGAARFEKELAAAAGGVESIQKHKCRAFLARRHAGWDAAKLAEWRALASPTPVPGTPFATTPGVFSAGRVDAGSALLAAHLPANLRGRAADLGAGWGFLSHAVLTRCPGVSSIDLFEADARALDLARLNLKDIATPAVARFHWHDVAAGIPEPGAFDTVVMNPPFHEGRRTDLALGEAFLTAAAAALRPDGRLWMVANRQLPYEAALARLGLPARIAAEDATYKILTSTRTR